MRVCLCRLGEVHVCLHAEEEVCVWGLKRGGGSLIHVQKRGGGYMYRREEEEEEEEEERRRRIYLHSMIL